MRIAGRNLPRPTRLELIPAFQLRKSTNLPKNRGVAARVPHPSRPCGRATFPPGEGKAPAAQTPRQIPIYRINYRSRGPKDVAGGTRFVTHLPRALPAKPQFVCQRKCSVNKRFLHPVPRWNAGWGMAPQKKSSAVSHGNTAEFFVKLSPAKARSCKKMRLSKECQRASLCVIPTPQSRGACWSRRRPPG